MTLPTSSKTIIVGGGIVGCSTAYHLAHMGQEVVLLDKAQLTSGSTWHAAGLVGQVRSSANITQLLGYSISLYDALEEETGLATGWKMNGGLRLACNEERLTEVRRQATTAHSFGLDMELLTPQEAQAAAKDGRILLVDIRRPDEWQKTGVPEGAVPIDLRRDDFADAVLAARASETQIGRASCRERV